MLFNILMPETYNKTIFTRADVSINRFKVSEDLKTVGKIKTRLNSQVCYDQLKIKSSEITILKIRNNSLRCCSIYPVSPALSMLYHLAVRHALSLHQKYCTGCA